MYLGHGPRKARTVTRLVKQDIVRPSGTDWKYTVRKRTSRHDPRNEIQRAYRTAMTLLMKMPRNQRLAWWNGNLQQYYAINVPLILDGQPIQQWP